MNKIIVSLALIVSYASAQINWAPSYDAALVKAAKEKKNVMVMLSKEGCPACEYMENNVFEEQMIEDTINKNFVPVHLDVHKDKIPSELGYIGTPTFHFLNAKGEKLKRYDGGANIPTFMGILNSVKK
ncbi:MAG: thioredoxin family protein [Campylobacterales bacterium]|nr:thioredoxin family protein [Campylobacterales bacterium]